jgi:hypothetical protein
LQCDGLGWYWYPANRGRIDGVADGQSLDHRYGSAFTTSPLSPMLGPREVDFTNADRGFKKTEAHTEPRKKARKISERKRYMSLLIRAPRASRDRQSAQILPKDLRKMPDADIKPALWLNERDDGHGMVVAYRRRSGDRVLAPWHPRPRTLARYNVGVDAQTSIATILELPTTRSRGPWCPTTRASGQSATGRQVTLQKC